MKTNLSIGIPTYNQGEYLQETIDSILNQTILPDQIVISNNHSDDILTDQILKKYSRNKLFKIILPNKFLKMCSNWNFTAFNCDSKYFSLISSDDTLEKNFVEEFVKHQNSKFKFYRLNFNTINEEGKILSTHRLRSVPKIQNYPNNFLNQFYGPKAAFTAFAVETKLFKEVGGYNEKYNYFADWEFLIKISDKTDFVHINKVVSNWRVSYRPGLEYKRLIGGGLDDQINTLGFIYNKLLNGKYRNFLFFHRIAVSIHMTEYIKMLKESDEFEKNKIMNFLLKTETRLIENKLLLDISKVLLRSFELLLRFIKIH